MEIRETIRCHIAEALQADADKDAVMDKATEIEEELFRLFKGDCRDYRMKHRTLAFNLKKNSDLRNAVMQGNLDAARLCRMSPLEMASKELKEEREKIEHDSLTRSAVPSDLNMETQARYVAGQWVPTKEAGSAFETNVK